MCSEWEPSWAELSHPSRDGILGEEVNHRTVVCCPGSSLAICPAGLWGREVPPGHVPPADQPCDRQEYHPVTGGEPFPPRGCRPRGDGQDESRAVLLRGHRGEEGKAIGAAGRSRVVRSPRHVSDVTLLDVAVLCLDLERVAVVASCLWACVPPRGDSRAWLHLSASLSCRMSPWTEAFALSRRARLRSVGV